MSTESPNTADEGMTLRAPVAEGDGYYKAKALQWVDLCPHMGAAEKTLLRVLTNLTTSESPTRRLKPVELRQMVYSGPVAVGQAPKVISANGLLRLLRSLAEMGQITAIDGTQLRFSSREPAQLRGISMVIWRYPRHECGCARNAFDALAITKGEAPRFGPTSLDLAAEWPARPSDQAGQEVDPPGYEVDPRGYEVDPRGQEVDPDSQGDQEKQDPPFTPPSSLSSSSSGASATPGTSQAVPGEEEEEPPTAEDTPASGAAADPVAARVREATGADAEEAAALVEILSAETKRSLSGYVRHLAGNGDLTHRLRVLRRQRAAEHGTGASEPEPERVTCGLHDYCVPCLPCRQGIADPEERPDILAELEKRGPETRPDLAALLGAPA
ncbi:hypothetical protein ACFQZ2_08185 [Streptomonospora algeriensis]|uniref:Uncharacterized protein n=1 Tax=Streptomonospora algeriensis TaxID=995084 RepID=A0ABW3BB28_9ACTN